MRKFTKNEIQFMKETGVTPTVIVCGEWDRSAYANEAEAAEGAKAYGVDCADWYANATVEQDVIGLYDMAVYLFYVFYSTDELYKLNPDTALQFLQNFKYHFGYRKWSPAEAWDAAADALRLHEGLMVLNEDENGEISIDYSIY